MSDNIIVIQQDSEVTLIETSKGQQGTSGATNLAGLTDVQLGPLVDGQMIVYDAGTGFWSNTTILTGGGVSDHTMLTNIGTSTHAQIDSHIGDASIHFTQAAISITKSQVSDFSEADYATGSEGDLATSALQDITAESIGDLSDVTITTLTTDDALRYDGADWVNSSLIVADLGDIGDVTLTSPASGAVLTYNGSAWIDSLPVTVITDHTALSNIGTNTHAQIDTAITELNAHFATGSPTNSHDEIDSHIADSTVHFTQAAISITKSQISDFTESDYATGSEGDLATSALQDITAESIGDLSDVDLTGLPAPINGQVLTYDGTNWVHDTPVTGVTDHTALSNIGTNTHAQIDSHISDATIHFTQAAISITKSQVSDFVEADYATGSEGDLATSALQPSDNISELTNDSAFIAAAGVTYENLDSNGDVGTGAGQLAIGNHTHSYLADVVDDTTPTLGGQLDGDGNSIINAPLALNDQTGTTYTGVLADAGKNITMTNASASTFTIPANASVAYAVGTQILVTQLGAGQVTIAITTDTLNVNADFTLKLAGQYSEVMITKKTSNMWVIAGDLELA